jgi:hypothetical protein
MSFRDNSNSPKKGMVDRKAFLNDQLKPNDRDRASSSMAEEQTLTTMGMAKRFIEDPFWLLYGGNPKEQSSTYSYDMMMNNEIALKTHRVLERHVRRTGKPKINLSCTNELCFYLYTQPNPELILELKDMGWACHGLEYRSISRSSGWEYRRPRYRSSRVNCASFAILLRFVSVYVIWYALFSYFIFVRYGYRFF